MCTHVICFKHPEPAPSSEYSKHLLSFGRFHWARRAAPFGFIVGVRKKQHVPECIHAYMLTYVHIYNI